MRSPIASLARPHPSKSETKCRLGPEAAFGLGLGSTTRALACWVKSNTQSSPSLGSTLEWSL
eukprot:6845469-Pyramimonas_sp.AAC.1